MPLEATVVYVKRMGGLGQIKTLNTFLHVNIAKVQSTLPKSFLKN